MKGFHIPQDTDEQLTVIAEKIRRTRSDVVEALLNYFVVMGEREAADFVNSYLKIEITKQETQKKSGHGHGQKSIRS